MSNMILKARRFAEKYHAGQKRKFIDEPYMSHLEGTARLLQESTLSAASEDYAAAILHDVVEDTPATLEDVSRHFGAEVMSLVGELTVDKELKEQMGKKAYMSMSINNMTSRAFTIKLCDRLHNITGLLDKRIPRKFVKWYWVDTNYILDNLNRKFNDDQKRLVQRMYTTLLAIKEKRLGG
jgi:(p)ppGpp synthase/HD superfamily hydrolase